MQATLDYVAMEQNHLNQELSRTFSVGSVIAIFFIVAIHYHSKQYIDTLHGIGLNYLLQEWITNSVARFAVPFFAATSGFFYFLKFHDISCYYRQTKKRLFSLVAPYFFAVVAILLHDTILQVLKNQDIGLDEINLVWSLMHPDSVQLWFLRDLIVIAIFLSPIVYLTISVIPRLTIFLLFSFWFFEIQISPTFFGWYFVNIETLLFFIIGAFFAKNIDHLETFRNFTERHLLMITATFFTTSIIRVLTAPDFSVWYGIRNGDTITLTLYKLTIISGLLVFMPIARRLNSNKLLLIISPFSFFLFLFHIKPTSTISINLGSLLVPDEYLFYVTTPLTIIITIFAGWSISKLTPTIYGFISGGR